MSSLELPDPSLLTRIESQFWTPDGLLMVLAAWPLDRILSGPLVTYSRYSTCTISAMREAGFELLATGASPHVDVVLPAPDTLWAETLARVLLPNVQHNPFNSRR